MAWHSGKPADTDFLSASVQHIRENFAELEPLHPHIGELVDLTALHPHIGELVDLTALHPHIAALLDSRIVEMGSNANGEYVRWENGLQVCWRAWSQSGLTAISRSVQGITYYYVDLAWTFPASFVANPAVMVGSNQEEALSSNVWSVSTTRADFASKALVSFTSVSLIFALAIGRWK